MTESMIDDRLRSRRWTALHRGVYAERASAPTETRALVAALAAVGPDSQASHLSAAWLLGIQRAAPSAPWVLAPPGRQRRPTGVKVFRSAVATAPVHRHGLPCTSAARTLIDCATVVPAADLADLVDRALAVRAVDIPTILRALDPNHDPSRRAGRRALRAVLAGRGHLGGPAPSVLESRMARLLNQLGIPQPQAEVRETVQPRVSSDPYLAKEYRLDFAWPDGRLAVEVDGYAWHSSPDQMRRDQRRRNSLIQSGWIVLVYTWRDVTEEPRRVGEQISAAYRRATSRRRLTA